MVKLESRDYQKKSRCLDRCSWFHFCNLSQTKRKWILGNVLLSRFLVKKPEGSLLDLLRTLDLQILVLLGWFLQVLACLCLLLIGSKVSASLTKDVSFMFLSLRSKLSASLNKDCVQFTAKYPSLLVIAAPGNHNGADMCHVVNVLVSLIEQWKPTEGGGDIYGVEDDNHSISLSLIQEQSFSISSSLLL